MAGSGPRMRGEWCCMCGTWKTKDNGIEECPVSRERMKLKRGLSHLWATGQHQRAMKVWEADANIRARLADTRREDNER